MYGARWLYHPTSVHPLCIAVLDHSPLWRIERDALVAIKRIRRFARHVASVVRAESSSKTRGSWYKQGIFGLEEIPNRCSKLPYRGSSSWCSLSGSVAVWTSGPVENRLLIINSATSTVTRAFFATRSRTAHTDLITMRLYLCSVAHSSVALQSGSDFSSAGQTQDSGNIGEEGFAGGMRKEQSVGLW